MCYDRINYDMLCYERVVCCCLLYLPLESSHPDL